MLFRSAKAEAHGLKVTDVASAVAAADLVMILTPDEFGKSLRRPFRLLGYLYLPRSYSLLINAKSAIIRRHQPDAMKQMMSERQMRGYLTANIES